MNQLADSLAAALLGTEMIDLGEIRRSAIAKLMGVALDEVPSQPPVLVPRQPFQSAVRTHAEAHRRELERRLLRPPAEAERGTHPAETEVVDGE